ncbi:hypothetical protein NE237_023552 [Protea cynaroides]|uniref:Retrotransposon Copia-like N-terminal domain-containing protein n=1 Tax=Protea cynaroides TaxID=273540 RepID=A0A9Q0HCC8_9MAGN|nr:hypothetical protein NE237_023552 [Protea cynaroides]
MVISATAASTNNSLTTATDASLSAGSSSPLVISNIASLIPLKLGATNYLFWKLLFDPVLHGHKQARDLLKTKYASTSPAHIMSLNCQLSRIKKGTQSMTDYLQQFKSLSDQLAAFDFAVSTNDNILLVLDGLPSSYWQFCSSVWIRACTSKLILEELHNLLLCEEIALPNDLSTNNSTTMAAFRPSSFIPVRGSYHKGSYRGHRSSNGHSSRGLLLTPPYPHGSAPHPICNISKKLGHQALNCYHRMDHAYHGRHPPERPAAMISSPHTAATTWYLDTGTTHHLTPDIESL